MQRGFTLIELVLVCTVLAVLLMLMAPRTAGWIDKLAVLRATEDFKSVYQLARIGAVHRSSRVRITIRPDSLTAVAEGQTDSILVQIRGPSRYGVSLEVSRSVIRLYPTGMGLGGANTSVVLHRGRSVQSLTISRLGRLRQW
jgi:prepilin-type N-terminal cleavage/methylation domain-containing protein